MKRLTDQTSMATAWWILLLTKLPRYKFLFRKLWWVVMLTTSAGLALAAWHTNKQPVVYVSTGRIMVSGKVNIQQGATYNEEQTYFSGTQMELMRSAEVRKRALARVASLHPDLAPSAVNLDVGQLKGTAIFVLTAVGSNPDFTREFLNASMEEYINMRKETRSEKSDTTLTALTDELGRIEKEIRTGDDELLAFQKKNNIGFLQEEGNSAATYLAGLNRQLADLKTEFQLLNLLDLDQTLDRGQKKGAGQDAKPAPEGKDPAMGNNGPEADYIQAKQEVEVLKIKRADLAKVLRPKHPDMIQLEQEISHQETLIETFRNRTLDQLKSRRESISLQIQNLEGVIKEWESKALDLSQRMAEYNNIKSKSERAKVEREKLLTNLRSLDMNKNVDQDVVSISDPATTATAVRMGMVRGILLGAGFGLIVGIVILFICDQIDDRISSFPEFQSYFLEPALTQVPKETGELSSGLHLLQHNDPRHAFVESFRALRSSIYYLPVEGPRPKVFLVTSGVPNEGKSTVASNLAITLSFAGAKTLLVDADLRRGYLQDKFGLKFDVGLSQILRGEAKLEDTIHPTGYENLSLVPRGAVMEHPGEKFLSKITDDLLKSIYNDYDYIVIDSAPVLVADDTTSLAPKVDAVIFVIRFSYSSARNCNEGLDCLRKRGANIIGLVCNDVDIESHNRYYSYYYSKYTDYYAGAAKQGA